MANDRAAAQLTEAHRLAQARIGAQTASQVLDSWSILDVNNLDATAGPWLRVVTPLVRAHKETSARLASNYYSRFKAIEVPRARPFVPSTVESVNVEQLTTSLLVTGPYRLKKASGEGIKFTRAVANAQASTAGAAMRQALAGGRDTIAAAVDDDKDALGWARATSGACCAFCAMLAGRGPVYGEDTADFQAHDHCTCTSEPVFSHDQAWPSGSREFQDRWNSATAGLGGQDAITAFRNSFATDGE